MRGMGLRPRFSVATILLVIAAIAVACAGLRGFAFVIKAGQYSPEDFRFWSWYVLRLSTPLWFPFVFAAFASGRRSLGWRMVAAFAVLEAAAVAISWWAAHDIY